MISFEFEETKYRDTLNRSDNSLETKWLNQLKERRKMCRTETSILVSEQNKEFLRNIWSEKFWREIKEEAIYQKQLTDYTLD